MDVYLPIAEMSVNVLLLLALGGVGGVLSGMFGVGGGFLLTPFLAFIGVPPAIAVGTQANQLVGTSLAGSLAHWKRRHIDIRMGLAMMIGSFMGTSCGVELFKWLQKIGHINLVITLSYVMLLGGVGGMMFVESARALSRKPVAPPDHGGPAAQANPMTEMTCKWGAGRFHAMDFPASRLRISVLAPIGVGFMGGLLVAMLGVGGGFILVPAMLYLLGMPPLMVNGTSLFQIIFTTAFTTVLQASLNHSVDIMLAMLILLGSVIGVPFGTRMAVKLKPEWARFLLALVILGVAGKLLADLAVTPSDLFSLETKLL